ncbi:hypothetical protein EDD15DRAFT_2267635 [Pisolithus albus]|nr:hypothetical protein EDD15DRAFT_2267635 [Pisolithus albus]
MLPLPVGRTILLFLSTVCSAGLEADVLDSHRAFGLTHGTPRTLQIAVIPHPGVHTETMSTSCRLPCHNLSQSHRRVQFNL